MLPFEDIFPEIMILLQICTLRLLRGERCFDSGTCMSTASGWKMNESLLTLSLGIYYGSLFAGLFLSPVSLCLI